MKTIIPINFDWKFYLEYYEDLRNAGLKSEQDALTHYMNHGKNEGRIYFNNLKLPKLDVIYDKKSYIFDGINLFGFGNTDSGLGHNMREIISALDLAEIKYSINIINPNSKQHNYLQNHELSEYSTNLIIYNPDYDNYGSIREQMENKYNIVVWAWELDKLPQSWIDISYLFSEIWTISEFCKSIIQKNIPNKKVVNLRIPADFKDLRDKKQSKINFGFQDKFVTLFVFDTHSDLSRKNPKAVIDAFNQSISNYSDTLLILKTHNLSIKDYNEHFFNLPKNIILYNETWSKDKLCDLFNATDLYVSLHRSEGSGLTIMEALDLEIPIVTTNYSGNLDFCDENCQLVNFELVDVVSNQPTYKNCKNSKWAEPNIYDASKKIIEVYKNYDEHKTKIKVAKKEMKKNFNRENLSNTIINNIF